MQEITVIGPGRMGGALALALSDVGYTIGIVAYHSRRPSARFLQQLSPRPRIVRVDRLEKIDSEIVFLTVPDDAIVSVADAIGEKISSSSVVFHTSGSISSDALGSLKARGCKVGSIHPLASISSPASGPERFRGAYFCIEGESRAVQLGRRLVHSIGGIPFTIDARKKPVYHAAAVTAAGHVTALFDLAASLMTKAGLDRKRSLSVLRPLLDSAAANLQTQDPVEALTGPFARADVATFDRQLKALGTSVSKSDLRTYLDLAARSLDLAEKKHKDRGPIAKMREMILLAKQDIE